MSNVTTEVCTLRLKYSQETFVLARDPLMGQILLGGLGALGVGQILVSQDLILKQAMVESIVLALSVFLLNNTNN